MKTNNKNSEIRVGPNIGAQDLITKQKKIIKLLEKGHSVKITMLFKGRNIKHIDIGEYRLLQLITALRPFGTCSKLPVLMNRKLTVTLKSKNV